MTASPFTALWLSASPPPRGGGHPAALNRRAEPGRGLHTQSAGPAHPDDPGQGAPGLADGGRLRPAGAWGDRHVRYKALIGRGLRARALPAQKTEARVGCAVLNRMTR